MAIVGIGAVSQQDDATIIRPLYQPYEQLMIGRKGAVGDILGYFLMQKVTLSRILKYITN